jgi:WD40 repeat protein
LAANHFFGEYLSLWDVELGREKQRFDNMRWQSSACVSPDERWVAIARMDGSVDVIDMATRRIVTTLQGHAHEVRRIYFTPDSRQLITATVTQFDGEGRNYGTDNIVRYWAFPSGQLIDQHEFASDLNGLALSPTGEAFAVSLEDGTTEVRRLPGFEMIWTDAGQGELGRGLSTVPMVYSPDGKKLASAVAMRPMFRVYNAESGELLYTSGLLDSYPLGLAFTSDGQSIAAGGTGSSVKFWNAATGQETIELPQPGAVYEIAFSGDHQMMAVATYALSARDSDPHARIYKGRPAVIAVHFVRVPSWQAVRSKDESRFRTGATRSSLEADSLRQR